MKHQSKVPSKLTKNEFSTVLLVCENNSFSNARNHNLKVDIYYLCFPHISLNKPSANDQHNTGFVNGNIL